MDERPYGHEARTARTQMGNRLALLSYPLAYHYWKTTGDASIFSDEWLTAIAKVLKTFKEQQRKEDPKGPYRFQRKTERALDTMTNDAGVIL